VNEVPVPADVLSVTVFDLAPALAGLNRIVLRVQLAPGANVRLAVQVPKGTVKSVLSL